MKVIIDGYRIGLSMIHRALSYLRAVGGRRSGPRQFLGKTAEFVVHFRTEGQERFRPQQKITR